MIHFKLFAAQLEEFQNRCKSPLDFRVDDYADAVEDVATSEAHLLIDPEIIARVTQTQLDEAEHDGKKTEQKMQKKVAEIKKLNEISLLK